MTYSETNLHRIESAMDDMRRAMAGARDRLGDGLQLTKTQLELLVMLSDGPRTTRDLASELYLTQSAVTQTIDTLVRRDYVQRHPDPDDRRIVRLQLSPAGDQLTAKVRNLRRTYMEALAGALSTEEVDVFIKVTRKVTDLLRETGDIPKDNVRG